MATNTEKIVVQVQVKGGKQLDNLTKKTGKATKSAGGLTKGMAKMAGGVLAATAAFRTIGKVISSSITTFKNFEFQMAKVRAVSGASNLDFQKLSQSAEDLGRSTFFTATQVAELQTNYAKLGFTTKEILQAQEATLLLATATGSDLARAAIVAGAAVRGFGLDASETGRVTDVMTLAFASSALDIEKWQTSMTKVAPIAAGMNIPLEETAAIMGVLTDAGIEASIAGTSMRNIFLQMKNPTSKLSQFLGFTVRSSEDLAKAMDKLSKASGDTLDGLVQVRQVAAFNVMVKGAKRVEQLTKKLLDAEGAAKRMADIVGDNLEGATKRFNSAWEGLLINFTDGIFGSKIRNVVEKMASLFNIFSDFIDIPVSEKLEEQRMEMNLLGGAIQRVWEDEKQRIRLIEELLIKYPEYFKDLDAEIVAYEDLEVAMAGANGEFLKTIQQQVMREEVALMTKEIREQQKAQQESSISIVAMLTGTKKIGTTYLKTTTALSTFKEATDELNQQFKDGTIDGVEYTAALLALERANRPASIATKKLTDLEEKRAKVLKEIDDLVGDGKGKGTPTGTGTGGEEGDGEWDTFKQSQIEIHKIRDEALLAENKRNLEFLQDKSKTAKEQEDNAKKHADKIIEIQTNAFNDEIQNAEIYGEEKTAVEQAFVDFQLNNIDKISKKQKESDEETLESNKEMSRQKLEVMKAASDAIFTIMSGNLSKQTERETKKLEEKKDAGLITEEQYEEGVEAIQRKAFEKKKRLDIAQAIINGALAMTTVAGQTGVLSFAFSPFIAAMTAAQIAIIASQKFAQGGMIEEFANGGLVQGKSHAQGGEKFAVGGRVVELEGGEAVINKRSTSMFSSQLSAMNAAGGGVKFADGGLLNQPSFSQQQFNALGQNQMMGAMGNSGKVTVVEADITSSQNTVSVIQSQATI